jgi:predicted ATPase/DNA-binding CsgD family transcriptional regulator
MRAGGAMPDRLADPAPERSGIRLRPRQGNLPAQLTSLVGRRSEIAEAAVLVRTSRLVTLTGVGGVGKTRLAMQVASDLRRIFVHGVWLVDLSAVPAQGAFEAPDQGGQEVDVLAYLVMSALDMRPHHAAPPVRELAGYLADRHVLLVLDNCEHVLPRCARLVDELLRACGRLRVLATSREPLAVAGEVIYQVTPLPVPDSDRLPVKELARFESVALFEERARAAVPDFALTERNGESVARLCRRLDGLPLAIELAAARVRALAPQQILARLTERSTLLSRGSRDVPARQQTLRACVEWSYELCDTSEQVLWSRLSVFVGGFELDAIERVCADDTLPADGLIDVLTGLVDKSIVERVDLGDRGGQARYGMLETLRGFGRERLIEAAEEATLRRRHRDWCRELIDRSHAQWTKHRQAYWFSRLPHEHANLRAAVEFCLGDRAEIETAMHMLVTWPRSLWANHGAAREALTWLDRALMEPATPTVTRSRATALAAGLSLLAGDAGSTAERLEQARHLGDRLDDPLTLALCAYTEANATWHQNDLTGAIEAAERGLLLLSRMAEPDPSLRLHLLLHALWAVAMAGDQPRSQRYFHQIREITDNGGDLASRAMAEWGIAIAAWRAGQVEEAGQHVQESVRIRQLTGASYVLHAGLNVELMAWIADRQQRHQRAATLLGAADSLFTQHGTPISTTYRMLSDDRRACEHHAREALGDEEYTRAFDEGTALTLADALAYIVDDNTPTKPSPPARPGVSTPLTRREHQVAELVARGMSNKDIARTLVISRRTAEGHVDHILTKLGFTSRAQIAAWITGR